MIGVNISLILCNHLSFKETGLSLTPLTVVTTSSKTTFGNVCFLEKKGNRGMQFFVKFLFCFTYKKIDKLCSNIFHSKLNRSKCFTINAVRPL